MTDAPAHVSPVLGVGLYSPAEAARLLGKEPSWVRRLVGGYEFKKRSGEKSSSPPLFAKDLPEVEGQVALSFKDLVELLFVRDFLEAGVSLYVIRRAAEVAAEMFSVDHPFCVKRFQTDGRRIFATASSDSGDDHVIDLVQRQHVFSRVVSPFMKQLEYAESGDVMRWFPLGRRRPVVLNPQVAFGAPVVTHGSVRTDALFGAFEAGETIATVARWYETSPEAVRAAVAFERRLAA